MFTFVINEPNELFLCVIHQYIAMQKFLETQKDAGVKSNFVPFLNFENRQAFRQTCRLAKRTIPHTPLVRITYRGNPRQNVLGYEYGYD